ncbi:hypothetical protein FOL47_004860 [Perkinsus chesapeaki]|uniref:Uncharacterized protein n=1 Tax=Perkinsus chesapeaki TaxID=330153 RepID=A0A7J6M0K9_PERCH|nr:hypothetical protein FOL47_004860 [Perkinsus chesapeaki]
MRRLVVYNFVANAVMSLRLKEFDQPDVAGVCPDFAGHVDTRSRLGIDSILACAQYTREHVGNNFEFVSFNKKNMTCMWSKSCECVAVGECPSGDPEAGWRSALIVRLLNTDLSDKPVRYERRPHLVGGDPVSIEDSGIELIPQRVDLPETVIWRLPKYKTSDVRTQYNALAPVVEGNGRMVGTPGLTASSEGGQLLMSRDAQGQIEVATDCSDGNILEFVRNFKESCSMRAIVRFTRMVTIAFLIFILILSWVAFSCTSGYRKKLRANAKASRKKLEALKANMPPKVEERNTIRKTFARRTIRGTIASLIGFGGNEAVEESSEESSYFDESSEDSDAESGGEESEGAAQEEWIGTYMQFYHTEEGNNQTRDILAKQL